MQRNERTPLRNGAMRAALASLVSLVMTVPGCGIGTRVQPQAAPRAGDPAIDAEMEQLRQQATVLEPSAEVGTIPGAASVDSKGQARFSIPIDVSPGPAGLAPQLSLDYASNRGEGLVGLGFELTGFSEIHRCAPNHRRRWRERDVRVRGRRRSLSRWRAPRSCQWVVRRDRLRVSDPSPLRSAEFSSRVACTSGHRSGRSRPREG